MMKRLAIILSICLFFTGCQAITFSVDELLSAPTIAEEQTSIQRALAAGIGKSVTLEYPHSGDYRSAIVLEDIDGIDGDEAIAFYSEAGDSDVKVAILDRDENGGWRLSCTADGAGTAIDKVIIHPLGKTVDVIIGYAPGSYEANRMLMYRYIDSRLTPIYDNSYTVLERFDIDNCGEDEIITAHKSGDFVKVGFIKSPDGVNYDPSEKSVISVGLSIVEHKFSKINENVNALYLDVLTEEGSIYTEMFYPSEDGIVCPTEEYGSFKIFTRRPEEYTVLDYDNDGVVEIPIPTYLTGYLSANLTSREYMTIWYLYNSEDSTLKYESNSYYSLNGSYVVKIPNRWLGLITAISDSQTGDVTFYKYDSSVEKIEDMTPLMTFASRLVADNESDLISEGYSLVKSTDRKDYYVKVLTEGESLVLTNDEILDNLYCLE